MNFKRSCNRDPGEVVCEDFSINCATEIREGISEMTRLVADSTPGRDLFFHCKRQIHRLTTTFKLEHNSIARTEFIDRRAQLGNVAYSRTIYCIDDVAGSKSSIPRINGTSSRGSDNNAVPHSQGGQTLGDTLIEVHAKNSKARD